MVDDRGGRFPAADANLIARLCDRHFGIGSDGLVLIQASRKESVDFHMEFFNPDASRSFCGNGSRCAFAFWSTLNGGAARARFTAIDGIHEGSWVEEEVCVSLLPVGTVRLGVSGPAVDFVHTGSPHQLVWVEDPDAIDLRSDAPARRQDAMIWPEGSNVNYVRADGGALKMRTFERGVEDETLSCGSGVVAAALSALSRGPLESPVQVRARGGSLRVLADSDGQGGFTGVRLIGAAVKVFAGTVEC